MTYSDETLDFGNVCPACPQVMDFTSFLSSGWIFEENTNGIISEYDYHKLYQEWFHAAPNISCPLLAFCIGFFTRDLGEYHRAA